MTTTEVGEARDASAERAVRDDSSARRSQTKPRVRGVSGGLARAGTEGDGDLPPGIAIGRGGRQMQDDPAG
jgi:hypothetical protein